MRIQRPLFDLLFGTPERVHQAAAAIDEVGRWEEVVRLAEAWRVLPRLTRVVRNHRLELDSSAAQALRARVTRYAVKSGYVARRAGELAHRLAEAEVEVAAFKGVATLARLHRSPAERMLSDIDLIVREEELEAALEVISSIGFKPWIDGSIKDQHNFSDRRIRRDNYSVNLIDPEGLEVDLHYRLYGGIDLLLKERLWQRCEPVPLLGRPVPSVSPLDAILLVTHHTLRSQFFPFPTSADARIDQGKLIYGLCTKNHPATWLKARADGIFEGTGTPKKGLYWLQAIGGRHLPSK